MGTRLEDQEGNEVKSTNKWQSCFVCGGTVKARTITYIQQLNGEIYLIDEVPAGVCVRCGEEYLSPGTVRAIEKTLEREQPDEMRTVPVYHFPNR